MERTATCRCGQLTATCRGEPVRIAVCHCLECQNALVVLLQPGKGLRATLRPVSVARLP
ncbi:MAG: GFA family protein [Tranquillimonas sp.]